jgi:hypothetical protein
VRGRLISDLHAERRQASVLPPRRCRSDAAFAALSGTSPLPASSGKTVRHRLNRGGDRALNRAIHTIAITRMRCCSTTKDYVARRTTRASPAARSSGASSATSPASSTAPSTPLPSPLRRWQLRRPLDKHRSVRRLGQHRLPMPRPRNLLQRQTQPRQRQPLLALAFLCPPFLHVAAPRTRA